MSVRKIHGWHYQRNGSGGESFYTVEFTHTDMPGRRMLAIIEAHYRYEHPEMGWQGTFVIDPADLSSKWRGDVLYHDLMTAGLWQQVQDAEDAEDAARAALVVS